MSARHGSSLATQGKSVEDHDTEIYKELQKVPDFLSALGPQLRPAGGKGGIGSGTTYPLYFPSEEITDTSTPVNIRHNQNSAHHHRIHITTQNVTINFVGLLREKAQLCILDFVVDTASFQGAISFNPGISNLPAIQTAQGDSFSIEVLASRDRAGVMHYTALNGSTMGTTIGTGGISFPIDYPERDFGSPTDEITLDFAVNTRHSSKITLSDDLAINLINLPPNRSAYASFEFTQDGAGGHVPSFNPPLLNEASLNRISRVANSIAIFIVEWSFGKAIGYVAGDRIFQGTISDASQWATFPASAIVNVNGHLLAGLLGMQWISNGVRGGASIVQFFNDLDIVTNQKELHLDYTLNNSMARLTNDRIFLDRPTTITGQTTITGDTTLAGIVGVQGALGITGNFAAAGTSNLRLIQLLDNNADLQLNGEIRRRGEDVWVRSGGASINLSNIGDGASSIRDLAEYAPADSDNNIPARFVWERGINLERVGRVLFNTFRSSLIGTFDGPITIREINPDNPNDFRTSVQTVMNFEINAQKTMAMSSQSRTFDDVPFGSVMEFFGEEKPLIKLVDTNYYLVQSAEKQVDIGSIYFDAQAPNTSSSSINFDQITFAEIKAIAETGEIDFPDWEVNRVYSRSDRVNYQGTSYICIALMAQGLTQENNPAAATSQWHVVINTSLDRGKLEFVLRDTNSAQLGGDDDTFQTLLTLDLDSGVHIGSHLTTDPDSYVILRGDLVMGLNSTQSIFCFSDLDLFGHKLLGMEDPEDPRDGVNLRFLENITDDITARQNAADQAIIALQNAGGGGSSIDLLNIASNILPDVDAVATATFQPPRRDLGSADRRWALLHSIFAVFEEITVHRTCRMDQFLDHRGPALRFFNQNLAIRPLVGNLNGTGLTASQVNGQLNTLINALRGLGLIS